jgi:hypothetical protein
MNSATASFTPSAIRTAPQLSLGRLYALRAAYFIMAVGLCIYIWPVVLHHTNDLAIANGIRFALLGGLGLTAAWGLRYPVQMLPVLLFELVWKTIYLLAFALPLWSAHQITPTAAEDIKAVAMVVIFIPIVPWRYVFAQYIRKPSERWK